MSTIAVFGVLAGGGAYAASKIGTQDISARAITAKKIDGGAVKSSKLRHGSVTGEKLADGAVGTRQLGLTAALPIAGVRVHNGEILEWFNRFDDVQPTVEHSQPGRYDIGISGIDPGLHLELLTSVSLMGGPDSQAGEVSARWTQYSDGSGLHPIVSTYDSDGSPADRSFTLVIHRADHGWRPAESRARGADERSSGP